MGGSASPPFGGSVPCDDSDEEDENIDVSKGCLRVLAEPTSKGFDGRLVVKWHLSAASSVPETSARHERSESQEADGPERHLQLLAEIQELERLQVLELEREAASSKAEDCVAQMAVRRERGQPLAAQPAPAMRLSSP